MYDLIIIIRNAAMLKKYGVLYAAGMRKKGMVKEMMMIPCLEEERKRST